MTVDWYEITCEFHWWQSHRYCQHYYGLLSTFIIEETDKFQLEVSEYEDVYVFLIQVHRPYDFSPWTLFRSENFSSHVQLLMHSKAKVFPLRESKK